MGLGSPWGRSTSFFTEWTDRNAAAVPDAGADHEPRRWPLRVTVAGGLVATLAAGIALTTVSASADPSAHTWYRLRMCESSDNYRTNTGNGHYGAYQFDLSTWQSVGGHGYPYLASKAEQDARALILYRMRGWQPWQCAAILGLREDSDARSGRTGDISIASGGSTSEPVASRPVAARPVSSRPVASSVGTAWRGIPAFPGGSHWYTYGETSSKIKIFQDQMHRRGFFPVGTGQYGPNTRRMVEQLQRLNGLVPNGYLGPNTWRLAWTGRYSAPGTGATPRIPAFPGGKHWYTYGETSSKIKIFQDQMHRRGFFPVGTGQYGPNTRRMVEQLQRLNGLVPNGYLGPNTWRLAWVGTYHD